ncbi:MAG: hypothetical protein ABH950_02870 [Candidatus Altiarchaeota archaeon]
MKSRLLILLAILTIFCGSSDAAFCGGGENCSCGDIIINIPTAELWGIQCVM